MKKKIGMLFICAGFAIFIFGFLSICSGHVKAAEKENTDDKSNLQTEVSYYSGVPELIDKSAPAYDKAIKAGQNSISRIQSAIVSKGRLQWGELQDDGTYKVYFDAADIYELGVSINASEKKYLMLYEEYQKAVEAVK